MDQGPTEVMLKVEGMSCGGCARAVENAIREVPGVETASVDLEAKRAVVAGSGLDASKLVEAVEEAGFSAREAGAA